MKKQLYQAPVAETIPILVQGYLCQSVDTKEVDPEFDSFNNEEKEW